ncbi:hypothetical protein ABMC89_06365 [Sulfitobacter sp. HNIBRBA3233]|uniref:hypothetical protein n=1 Tax=Sulfitobacter marinivivus TaxID=3158558 RepID=UPI0032DF6728
MRLTLLALASFVSLAAQAVAQTHTAAPGVEVAPVESGFAVLSDGGLGARGYWCGAADYARDILGARGNARIYVASPRPAGLGQRSPVVFTLDPAGLTPRAATILGATLSQPGSNLSVGHAYGFCADFRLITNGDI